MTLRDQAVLTANALRNMAGEMGRTLGMPDRFIGALQCHADDLMRAASLTDASTDAETPGMLQSLEQANGSERRMGKV